MLIPSDRHTAIDLTIWSEHESADLVRDITRHVSRSMIEIIGFISRGPCYCSVSWGKDSVVLAHLVRMVDPSIPLVHFRSDENKYPHDVDVQNHYLEVWPTTYHDWVVTWPQRGRADWVQRERLVKEKLGTDRCFLGIRADESDHRRLSCLVHGISTNRKCRPLAWWRVDDVFAYLAQNNLPVHPNYAMLGGGRWERNQLRVSGLGGLPGRAHGRAEWEREYYGDWIDRMEVDA